MRNEKTANRCHDGFLFLRFPARRRLRVFEVWISRRRVGFGTKTPGEALLRKCINPLRYFHPEAAKSRGLCEADAAVATAYAEGICHCEPSAHAGRGNPFSPRMGTDSHVGLFRPPRNDRIPPARAAWICGCPVWENHTVIFPQPPSEAKLPSSGRGGAREMRFAIPVFQKLQNGDLPFLTKSAILCAGKKEKRLFPACCSRRFGSSRFLCAVFLSGARSPLRCNHPASLLSLILLQAIFSVHHPLSNGFPSDMVIQIFQNTG